MLICPRCRATYENGTVRFCSNDNTRLKPVPAKDDAKVTKPKGVFSNILGENLLIGEDQLLRPRTERSNPKDRRKRGKPLFAPSFRPPKGSRFFKPDDWVVEKTGGETTTSGSGESQRAKTEVSFKDMTLAGVISNPDAFAEEEEIREERLEQREVAKQLKKVVEEDKEVAERLAKVVEEKVEIPEIAEVEVETEAEIENEVEVEISEVDESAGEDAPIVFEIEERVQVIEPIGINDDDGIVQEKAELPEVVEASEDNEVSGDDAVLAVEDELQTEEEIPQLDDATTKADGLVLEDNEQTVIDEPAHEIITSAKVDASDRIGLRLKERYRITAKMGEDEIGTVYLAEDELSLNRKVVVTIFPKQSSIGANVPENRFGDTKELLTQIKHPNIEFVFEADTLSSGDQFIISEFLEGKPLSSAIENEEPFDGKRAADIVRQISFGLNDLHEKGFIYRNLRPENIILSISDAGTEQVKVLNPVVSGGEISDEVIDHKSPEQLEENIITIASDTYSLGSIAYLMLTSRMPFKGANAKELLTAQNKRPEFYPSEIRSDLPKSLDAIFKKALAFNPADRYIQSKHFGNEFLGVFSPESLGETANVESAVESEDRVVTILPEAVFEVPESTGLEQDAVVLGDEIHDLDLGEFDDDFEVEAVFEEEFLGAKATEELDVDEYVPFGQLDSLDDGVEETIDLNVADDLLETDDQIFGIVEGVDESLPVEDDLDFEDSGSIELDLEGINDSSASMPSDEFELDVGGTDDGALNVAVSSVLSDMSLGFEDDEPLPAIELDLDNSVESPGIKKPLEPLPAFEFDLDKMEKQTRSDSDDDIRSGKDLFKPTIRIISPEKPYYKAKDAEILVEETVEATTKPILIPAGEVPQPEKDEIGKKIVGDVEEKEYSWVILPLLLLALLIAAFIGFWYFSGQGNSGVTPNANAPADDNRLINPDQSLSVGQTNINGVIGNDNSDDSEITEDINGSSYDEDFGDDFGAPGGVGTEGTFSQADSNDSARYTKSRPKPPPPARKLEKAPNKIRYRNTKQTTPGKLKKDFLGFTVDYPTDWTKNSANSNFLDISKNSADGTPIKQFLVTKYNSTGTFEGDRELFEGLVSKSTRDLKKVLPNYSLISEGEMLIQQGRWRAYEVKFKGDGRTQVGNQKLIFWGRRFWIPIQRSGMNDGFVITLLASSRADDVTSVDDVGDAELAEILNSFEPTITN